MRALLWAAAALLVPLGAAEAAHADQERCDDGAAKVAEGYTVKPNRWNAKGALCVTYGSGTSFTVSKSTLTRDGRRRKDFPGAFPHIGTSDEDGRLPRKVNAPGSIRTTWYTVPAEGAYATAYGLWFHPKKSACTTVVSDPLALEVKIWLRSPGVDPSPSWRIAENIELGDRSYDLYKFTGASGQTGLIYLMREEADHIADFDLTPFAQDAAVRKFQGFGDHLCNVQAGFEIAEGGAGLKTDSFAFEVSAKEKPKPQAPAPQPSQAPTASAPMAKGREDRPSGALILVFPALGALASAGGIALWLHLRRQAATSP